MTDARTQSPGPAASAETPASGSWSVRDAETLYAIDRWSEGHFSVSERGTVLVHPTAGARALEAPAIDLHSLTEDLRARGVTPPLVIRFPDLLRHRIARLRAAFTQAIDACGYGAPHRCLYPIKANQHRLVCEAVRSCADPDDPGAIGFEAGSKPELLAALALTAELPGAPIVCNGYKDDAFLDAILLATRLGREVIPIVERMDELDRLLARAQALHIRPSLGLRIKPSSPGAGRWHESAGSRSKFGLRPDQILEAAERLRARDMLNALTTLHVHAGSQVCDLAPLTEAVTETARVYTELRAFGAEPTAIDVGGGLGLDYQGTRSTDQSSMNYTLEGYARAVIDAIAGVCDGAGTPHPRVMTEAGRATVGPASVLIFDLIGASRPASEPDIDALRAHEHGQPGPTTELIALTDELAAGDCDPTAALERARHARAQAARAFNAGELSLATRSRIERLYWSVLRRAEARAEPDDPVLNDLRRALTMTCDANLSVFQSVPDAWAIGHVFPVAPIHGLDKRPAARGVLGDVTCDSDGALATFPGAGGTSAGLPIHEPQPGVRCTLACFLVGAYQEVLGDVHNLFGNPAIASVSVGPGGQPVVDAISEGERASDVLAGVGFEPGALRDALAAGARTSAAASGAEESDAQAFIDQCERLLGGWTYPD